MIFLVSEVKDRIQMWALRNFEPGILQLFTNDEFIDLLNQVQRDMNTAGQIHWERYNRDTTSGTTNYEMSRVILEIAWFYYKSDDWTSQHWTFINDTIVLEDTPSGEVEMDIESLGDTEDVLDDTDEIDLPETMQHDFLELVRAKFAVEFGKSDESLYQMKLDRFAKSVPHKRHHRDTGGVWRHWGVPSLGDEQYDITENWIENENLVTDVDGNYYFLEYT